MKSNLQIMLLLTAVSHATPLAVIYSNLNPDPRRVFDDAGYDVFANGTNLPFGVYTPDPQLAMPFTTAAVPPYPTAFPRNWGWQLTQIDIPARFDTGLDENFNVFLYSDSGGQPGPLVTSGVMMNIPALNHTGFNCCQLSALTFSTRVGLLPGLKYWLAIQPIGHDGGVVVWLENNMGATGTMYNSDARGVWQPFAGNLSAFDVMGFPLEVDGPLPLPEPPAVPEPSAGLLAFAGLAVISMGALRSRIRGFRAVVQFSPTACGGDATP